MLRTLSPALDPDAEGDEDEALSPEELATHPVTDEIRDWCDRAVREAAE